MPAVHLSAAELSWLLTSARAFGPPWLVRKLEREADRETPDRSGSTVHISRAEP